MGIRGFLINTHMPYTSRDLNEQIRKISDGETLLDMLLEFEGVLDDLDLYAYKNWDQGEILSGPDVGRHFVNVDLMYMGDQMPDPEGARRLLKRGIPVKYEKDTLTYAAKPPRGEQAIKDDVKNRTIGGSGNSDVIRVTNKKQTCPVWIVTIQMPRRFLDSAVKDFVDLGEDDLLGSTDEVADVQTQISQDTLNPDQAADVADLDDTEAEI